MKFKNYVNSLTGDNRIFSNKEIADMSVREVFKNKDAIMSQHSQVGIPSEKELQANNNVVYVQAYTRDDGTEVKAHYRSKPDGVENNNLSVQKNSGTLTGGASEISAIKNEGIIVKSASKISEEKNKLIEYNNTKNADNKDARELMNIAIIGTNNIANTKNLSILGDEDAKNLSKELGHDLCDGVKTVEFSAESTIAKEVNLSNSLRTSINEWVKMPDNKRPSKIAVKIADNINLFRSINNATILNPHIDNGYFYGYLYDKYDFKLQLFKDLDTMIANSAAFFLQAVKQLENYNIIIPIKIKL